MLFTVMLIVMDLGVKGGSYLPGSAAEIDESASRGNPVHRESMLGKPTGDELDIFGGWAEERAELFGGEPLVEIGRMGIILLLHEVVERLLLGCSTP